MGQALSGQPLTVHGDGTQTRCFTYVADTVRGTVLAARSPGGRGNVFNLGTEQETTVRELADLVIEVTGSTSGVQPVTYESAYGGRFEDAPRRQPDTTRARTVLGWQPTVELRDGLDRTFAWWKATHG